MKLLELKLSLNKMFNYHHYHSKLGIFVLISYFLIVYLLNCCMERFLPVQQQGQTGSKNGPGFSPNRPTTTTNSRYISQYYSNPVPFMANNITKPMENPADKNNRNHHRNSNDFHYNTITSITNYQLFKNH